MKTISDSILLKETKLLVEKERKTLKEILEHLQEIFDRRLFADLGYSSLHKYLVKELKYSEGAAARRVAALKLVKKVPQAKRMIERGELNLTVVSKAQSHTNKISKPETRKILNRIKGKTTEQAEKMLFSMTDGKNVAKFDQVRRLSSTELRLHITVSENTQKKLKLIKDYFNCNTDRALDLALDSLLDQRKAKLSKIRKSQGTQGRRIPSKVKKEVVLRAGSQCEYPGCKETRKLQFEHTVPYAKGGNHTPENIKLYCRAHNQRAAILEFGKEFMSRYLQ